MKLIDRLNDKLNYNQEMCWLFSILLFIFFVSAVLTVKNIQAMIYFSFLGSICLGIAAAYFIYKRDDDPEQGYKVRDKIRGWFKK